MSHIDLDTVKDIIRTYNAHKSWLYYIKKFNIDEDDIPIFKRLIEIIRKINNRTTDIITLKEMAEICKRLNILHYNDLDDDYPHLTIILEDARGIYGEHSTRVKITPRYEMTEDMEKRNPFTSEWENITEKDIQELFEEDDLE